MDIAKTDIRLSVVVPFYNAERHIGDCVHSLMRQSLSGGIEFIFVNDSSTDASEAVLQAVVSSYPQRRDQVTVLRNDINRGSAYSRQRGVDAASGEFVIYCDADDWVDAEMYGITPNAKIEALPNAPPENMFRRPTRPPWVLD